MSLNDFLSSVLPVSEQFEYLSLQSIPLETHAVVTPNKDDKRVPKSTIKTQHFFSLFHQGKVFFSLEVYVYVTLWDEADAERLIFVSKADTNGYCNTRVSIRDITKIILEFILSIDPNYYLQKVKPAIRSYKKISPELISAASTPARTLRILARRLKQSGSTVLKEIESPRFQQDLYLSFTCPREILTKICLFTRPASQYLFPDSSKNSKKHILNGEELMKWWGFILDRLLIECFQNDTQAKLRIPGEDPARVRSYLRGMEYPLWQVGDIFTSKENSLAVYNIPLFPDDPKARFIHQLADEDRLLKVSLSSFWIELQERQEFKLSVTSSVMGISGYSLATPSLFPSSADVIVPKSRKQFRAIKKYITGEEYDTEEGAIEAFTNIRDFLLLRMATNLQSLTGKREHRERNQPVPASNTNTLAITMLKPRKKAKALPKT
ncbi:BAK_1a_G0034620.mRNA.1.CDS.1 [Saccharomyces cerevisiae]|nr:BAK_1a_G0034620.mRNA.1.CDS.1 [Saccharomyces cerevisiae]CAI7220293.1 BAK_1a_G0034620.mRNA.1.CDS.1 [Saccharomyces cerevisiae]